MLMVRKIVTLSAVPIDAAEDPPSDVLLLRRGWNRSGRGDFLIDDTAIDDVIAAWRQHTDGHSRPGMIDLEHLSLDPASPNFDPDPRAWFDLQATDDGLRLVDLSWLPDGDRRVRGKLQRFLSPTFYFDEETRRVTRLINVALTALPELHSAPELVAARLGDPNMAEDNSAARAAILKAMGLDPKLPDNVAKALGLEAGASLEDIRGAVDAFAAKLEQVDKLLSGDAAADAEPAADVPAAEPAAAEEPPPVAMRAQTDEVAALRQERDDARAALRLLETRERKSLVASMVAGGHESPATAWSNPDAASNAQEPAEPWASMPLASLRARVERLSAAPGASVVTPPTASGPAGLTAAQLAICEQHKIKPEDFIAMRTRAKGN
jgi:hypothetical protein